MAKFKVRMRWTETVSYSSEVEVEASSRDQAESKARDLQYDNCEQDDSSYDDCSLSYDEILCLSCRNDNECDVHCISCSEEHDECGCYLCDGCDATDERSCTCDAEDEDGHEEIDGPRTLPGAAPTVPLPTLTPWGSSQLRVARLSKGKRKYPGWL